MYLFIYPCDVLKNFLDCDIQSMKFFFQSNFININKHDIIQATSYKQQSMGLHDEINWIIAIVGLLSLDIWQ